MLSPVREGNHSLKRWCERRELNPHGLPHWILRTRPRSSIRRHGSASPRRSAMASVLLWPWVDIASHAHDGVGAQVRAQPTHRHRIEKRRSPAFEPQLTYKRRSTCRGRRILPRGRRYPADVKTIVMDFELNVFCSAGAGRGHYLGRATWQWKRAKSSAARRGVVSALPAVSLDQPSAEFRDALQRWADRTGFALPTPINPPHGGTACP
jgi:hypothetical protein